MKVSEISENDVINYARMDATEEDISPQVLLTAAKAFVRGYTGLDDTGMDEYEDLSIAILVLCSDMYDNRQTVVENDKVNRVVQSILDLHPSGILVG